MTDQASQRSGIARRVLQQWPLIVAALFAFVLAVVRASVQSITLDEADTYFWFARSAASIWHPFPNNHTLNTLLIWIATHVFGLSTLTVRTPALLGAILYISTCYFLCRSIIDRLSLQLPVLICLIYNPFVLDFMVAARGYGLADAFLLAAIAIPVWYRRGAHSLLASCGWASLALGLSFAANFSFAFVDLAAFLTIVTWAIRRRGAVSIVRVMQFCVLPGLFVALLLCGYPLAHWPKEQLWYGAHSLAEMTQSLVEASLYQPNQRFLDADLSDIVDLLRLLLLPLLGILCVCQLVVTALDGSWRQAGAASAWLGKFAAALIGIMAFSVGMSWLAFRYGNLPLPLSRTGIYLIPLCTLVAGVIAAAPGWSVVSRRLRQGITGVFMCLACYFLLCLRVTYFKEYEFGAEVKDVYSILARLNHTYGVTDVAANGFYVDSLNFYRVMSKRETFPEFVFMPADGMPSGKSIYVLQGGYYRDFIEKEKLAIIYRGDSTEIVIAVRPDGPIPPVVITR